MDDCILIVFKQNDLGMYWKHEIGLLRHFFRVDFLLDPLVFTVFMNIQNKLILLDHPKGSNNDLSNSSVKYLMCPRKDTFKYSKMSYGWILKGKKFFIIFSKQNDNYTCCAVLYIQDNYFFALYNFYYICSIQQSQLTRYMYVNDT